MTIKDNAVMPTLIQTVLFASLVQSQISLDNGLFAVPLMLVLNVPMVVTIFALPVKEIMTSAKVVNLKVLHKVHLPEVKVKVPLPEVKVKVPLPVVKVKVPLPVTKVKVLKSTQEPQISA
jgi:hypothetical protein